MIKIYGIPISVHTRKAIVTAILKNIDYSLEGAVIPFIPPRNWTALSPTGLIPVMQDGEFSTAESTSICVYLERKKPAPPILPDGDREFSQAMFFDGWLDIPHFQPRVVLSEGDQSPDLQGRDRSGIDRRALGAAAAEDLRLSGIPDRRQVPGRTGLEPCGYQYRVKPDQLSVSRLHHRSGPISEACEVHGRHPRTRTLARSAEKGDALCGAAGAGPQLPVIVRGQTRADGPAAPFGGDRAFFGEREPN